VTASTTGGEGGELRDGVSPAEWGGRKVPAVDRFPGLHLPDWFQTLGRGAWLLVGIAVLLAIGFLLLLAHGPSGTATSQPQARQLLHALPTTAEAGRSLASKTLGLPTRHEDID
jgi:hypothetical protein